MIAFLVFIVIAAFMFAKLEIEIEGRHGWAEKLPTWRIEHHVLLFVFHLPFFWANAWSVRSELHAVGGYTLFWIIEDLLWFILNPHYGWKKFTRHDVWWHKRWALGLPLDYWILGTFAAVLLIVP